MSRSRKHLPIRGVVPADSDRAGKQQCHRRLRRRERQCLALLSPDTADAYLPAEPRAVALALPKHGKEFVSDPTDAWLAVRK